MSHALPHTRAISLVGFDEKMTTPQLVHMLTTQLARPPDPADLYYVSPLTSGLTLGKMLYQSGAYLGATKILQLYVDGNGWELPGPHLLGHALWMTGDHEGACAQLRRCVNHGFDSDWQLLVELQLECDRAAQQRHIRHMNAMMASSSASPSQQHASGGHHSNNNNVSLAHSISSSMSHMLSDQTPPLSPRAAASQPQSLRRQSSNGPSGVSLSVTGRRSVSPVKMMRASPPPSSHHHHYGAVTVGMVDQHASQETFNASSPPPSLPSPITGSSLSSPSVPLTSSTSTNSSGGSSTYRRHNNSGGRLRSKAPMHVPPLNASQLSSLSSSSSSAAHP